MGSTAKGLALIPELVCQSSSTSTAVAAATAAVLGQGISQGWNRWAGQVHARQWLEKPYFAQERPSGTKLMTAPDPPNGIMYVKVYPPAPRNVLTVLQPRSLIFSMVKSLFLQALIVVVRSMNDQQLAVDNARQVGQEAEDPDPVLTLIPPEDVKPILKRSSIGFLRDVAVQTVRHIYEILAGQKLDPRIAWKLRKGFKTSAIRKRFLPWCVRPYRVTKTALTSSLLGCLAEWTVTSYIDMCRLSKQGWQEQGIARFTRRLLLRCTANAIKTIVCAAGACLGAGVASAVWPGTGTLLGYNAADLALAFMLVNPLVDKWFGGLPPPAALDAARTGVIEDSGSEHSDETSDTWDSNGDESEASSAPTN
ncbi:hypothetical protein ABBQ38_004344 [Trebouxia sp. C0009 RCD-2024]